MRVKSKFIILCLALSAVFVLSLTAAALQVMPDLGFSFPALSFNGTFPAFDLPIPFPQIILPSVTPSLAINDTGGIVPPPLNILQPQNGTAGPSSRLVLMIANPPPTGQIYNMPMMPASSLYYTVEVMRSSDPAIAAGTYATLILNFNPGQPPSDMVAKALPQLVTDAVLGINDYTYDGSYKPYAKIEVDIPIGTDWRTKVTVISSPAS